MNIPIENIYYLLCYAWNKLEEKDKVAVSPEMYTNLLDLFAHVLINASKILLKRGIDKNYIDNNNEISGIKGKIDFSNSIRNNLLSKQKAICRFDEYSINNLLNRILVTTILRLIKTSNLDKNLKNQLIALKRMFTDVQTIGLTHYLFSKIKFHRNNNFYSFIINICRLIFENTLPSQELGIFKFSDFIYDEKQMNKLFEDFIRNFYKIEQKRFNIVKRENIYWQFEINNKESDSYLPIMQTDITLQNSKEKIIIDAKFYSKTLVQNRFEQAKINSNNLYQLFSYLINQEKDSNQLTKSCTGVLIYPTINYDYNLNYKYKNHKILIRTLNLNTKWELIKNKLLEFTNIEA